MPRHRLIVFGAALAAWLAFAGWQVREYRQERAAARESLAGQAEVLSRALVGGIRSHRRFGPFFEDQLEGIVEELAGSPGLLAVAVVPDEGEPAAAAGKVELLGMVGSAPPEEGAEWEAAGLRYVAAFRLTPEPPHGQGLGPGFGRGWGMRWRAELGEEEARPVGAEGGRFFAVLVLDRAAVDAACRRAAVTRTTVAGAGGLILILLAAAWQTTVHLADARGRERTLRAEARYLRDLGQAAAGLAHETRNPLGLVRGWTQRLAKAEGIPPALQRQAESVVEECDRVTARINQFLAFARPCHPRRDPVDARALIEELRGLVEPDFETHALSLHLDAPEDVAEVSADREMLRQALFNLVDNAAAFAPEGGAVEVSLDRRNGAWRIEVADRGPGVAAEQVESLFTPYFTTRPGGTGLGLAIVARIAAAHGWHCGYRPRPGGGAVFFLEGIDG